MRLHETLDPAADGTISERDVVSDSIVMRRADSELDKLAVMAISRDATRPSEPLAFYQARRFRVAKRRTGTWWLLEDAGEPAASLLCYPLDFSLGSKSEERIAGFGLGAVATKPTHRRRGFASMLCEHAGECASNEGRSIGLLFSAIAPAFYERIGYRVAPAVDHSCEDLEGLVGSGTSPPLRAFDPQDALDQLTALYRQRQSGLHLERDAEAWQRSIAGRPHDFFLTSTTPKQAYLRLAVDGESLEIVEGSLSGAAPSPEMIRAVAELALGLGLKSVHSWLEASEFTDRGRAAKLPMVKGIPNLSGAWFSSADYF